VLSVFLTSNKLPRERANRLRRIKMGSQEQISPDTVQHKVCTCKIVGILLEEDRLLTNARKSLMDGWTQKVNFKYRSSAIYSSFRWGGAGGKMVDADIARRGSPFYTQFDSTVPFGFFGSPWCRDEEWKRKKVRHKPGLSGSSDRAESSLSLFPRPCLASQPRSRTQSGLPMRTSANGLSKIQQFK
jgi:hypothetical protein